MVSITDNADTDSVATEKQTAGSEAEATPPALSAPLTKAECVDRDKLVTRFKQLADHWVESTEILMEIRDRRLYRGKHHTFEEFCRKELRMSRSNANRQCQSMAIAQTLATLVAKPEKEEHVRPLLRLKDVDDQIEAFRKARDQAKTEKKPLTGGRVRRAVREILDAQMALREKPDDAELRPLTKADVITRIRRETGRYLERLEVEQLEQFEVAVAEFMACWLETQSPLDEVAVLKVGGEAK